MTTVQRVGRIPLALGLIAYGAAKLADSLDLTRDATGLLLKLWPLLLIGIGLEYLLRTLRTERGEEAKASLRFDFAGAFLLLLAVGLGSGITAAQSLVQRIGVPFSAISTVRTVSTTIPATGVKAIQVSSPTGSIEVQPGNPDEIRIEATFTVLSRGADPQDVARQLDQMILKTTPGEVVSISAEGPSQYGYVSTNYVIHAPPGLRLVASTGPGSIQVTGYNGELKLTSQMGSIRVDSASGSLTAASGTGHVVVHDFNGPLSVKTTMGTVDAANTRGSLRLESASGSVTAQEFAGGPLEVHTTMGSIRATTSAPITDDVTLVTQSGAIRLSLPAESSIQVNAHTRTGTVVLPAPMQRAQDKRVQSATGTLGDGRYHVELESTMGTIALLTR